MSKRSKQPKIMCQFFAWRLMLRDGVFYADGRGGHFKLGKHSLNSRDRNEAIQNLRQLDHAKAIELGLSTPKESLTQSSITISEGWNKYETYFKRPSVMGGASEGTAKRYRAVRHKHEKFCRENGIETWNSFDKFSLKKYASLLSRRYAERTVFLELTTLKSLVKWLVSEKYLPRGSELNYSLRKPQGTDTYCYSPAEVTAMIRHCRVAEGLGWMGDIITTLAFTGLRIGELTTLRWTDIRFHGAEATITVADERASSRKRKLGNARTTKGKRSRVIPIHPELRGMLMKLRREPDGFVLRADRGGQLHSRNVLQALIDKAIEPLKSSFPTPQGEIGFEHGRLHGFRHYFCSQAFLGGASEGEIKDWLGHADSKMVEHYRHLRNEDAQRKMAKIEFVLPPDQASDGAA